MLRFPERVSTSYFVEIAFLNDCAYKALHRCANPIRLDVFSLFSNNNLPIGTAQMTVELEPNQKNLLIKTK